jgi:hypothetical protein
MSYLLNSKGKPFAWTELLLPSGTEVKHSSQTQRNVSSMTRQVDLVNPETAKISNAMRWDARRHRLQDAVPINDGTDEFLVR